MQEITSNQNSHVKEWAKMQSKKGRNQSGKYLLEGWHLVNEALDNHLKITDLMVTDETYLDNLDFDGNARIFLITNEVASHISSTNTPEGVFATAKITGSDKDIPNDISGGWLLLDGVQDPGNIGTMVRTADAAGLQGVVFGKETANLYNPKVVRSMQGSQFHIQLYSGDMLEWINALENHHVRIFGTELDKNAVSLYSVKPQESFALIMGNEGNGVSQRVLNSTTQNIYIPMKGNAESLNVAIATGIVLFQLVR